MNTNTRMLVKQLIHNVVETHIRGTEGKEQRDQAIQKAFRNCMLERIIPMFEKRKKEIAYEMFPRAQQDEDFKSFVGALGHTVAHAAAGEVASAIGVKPGTVTHLAHALMKPSKKSTTRMPTSRRPTTTKKKPRRTTGKPRPKRQFKKMKASNLRKNDNKGEIK